MKLDERLTVAILHPGMDNDGVTHEMMKKAINFEVLGDYPFFITGNAGHHSSIADVVEDKRFSFVDPQHTASEGIMFPFMTDSNIISSYRGVNNIVRKYREFLLDSIKNEGFKLPNSNLQIEVRNKIAAECLKGPLMNVIKNKNVDLIVAENIFSLPMQVPLSIALGDLIMKHKIPAVLSNHDFYWERDRYKLNQLTGILSRYFPFSDTSTRHLVINSTQQQVLANPNLIPDDFGAKHLAPINAKVLPNCFDYNFNPDFRHTWSPVITSPVQDNYNLWIKEDFGLNKDDIILLQNTRVVERKQIQLSIDFLEKLKIKRPNNNYKLVISLMSKDEGDAYYNFLIDYSKSKGLSVGHCTKDGKNEVADVMFIGDRINSVRKMLRSDGGHPVKIYHYLDSYTMADFICYPSYNEGWGNCLGESWQAKKPIMLNRYDVYDTDIRPLGFKMVEINNSITDDTIEHSLKMLEDKIYRDHCVETNFQIAKNNFGFDLIKRTLSELKQELMPAIIDYRHRRENNLLY
jgi:mannosylglucosylglycerate synthase